MSTKLRAAAYYRVSTQRQAKRDLSIPDQRRHAQSYCADNSLDLVHEFVEPGKSGTDANRPVFRQMMEMAVADNHPFDVILVHSLSRFARDATTLLSEVRHLKLAGVDFLAMTQEVSDDPEGEVMLGMMGLFDGYQSAMNAKHTLRSMIENARRGYWNGSRAPDGYQIVDAGRLGDKTKRRIEVHPERSKLIRKIFDLALTGDGDGPMGVKAITNWLNAHGHLTQCGARWGIGTVHQLLTRRTYIGEHVFNQHDSKTRKRKSSEHHIVVAVPPIVDLEVFEAVQRAMKARNPRTTPTRVTTGPCLMTGVLFCGHCGGAMTLMTGKGGRYQYYACATKRRVGPEGCQGQTIRMDMADRLVTEELVERALAPERLTVLIGECVQRLQRQNGSDQEKLALKEQVKDATIRLQRLYDAIAAGTIDAGDSILKEQVGGLKLRREDATARLKRMEEIAKAQMEAPSPKKVKQFSDELRRRLLEGDITLRKAYLRTFVDQIVVAEQEIRITGRKEVLAASALRGQAKPVPAVPTSVPNWRARQDSNL